MYVKKKKNLNRESLSESILDQRPIARPGDNEVGSLKPHQTHMQCLQTLTIFHIDVNNFCFCLTLAENRVNCWAIPGLALG